MTDMNITNCPNCGAPLDITGRCKYCGTNVKIVNSLDFNNKQIELNILVRSGNDVVILPVVGRLNDLEIKAGYYQEAEIGFNFDGYIRQVTDKEERQ